MGGAIPWAAILDCKTETADSEPSSFALLCVFVLYYVTNYLRLWPQ